MSTETTSGTFAELLRAVGHLLPLADPYRVGERLAEIAERSHDAPGPWSLARAWPVTMRVDHDPGDEDGR